jgi:predicted NBD/HSP70 family sugar kinase
VGAARGVDNFVLVWLSGGLGMATVLGGRVHKGISGAAGEIGYLPVPGTGLAEDNGLPLTGGFHTLVGGRAVQALAESYGIHARDAAAAVEAGVAAGADESAGTTDVPATRSSSVRESRAGAREFIDELGRRVAIGIASVCSVLDPDLVVLAGEVGHAGGAPLADRVANEVARTCLAKPRVVAASVTGNPVVRGALQVALGQARQTLRASVSQFA